MFWSGTTFMFCTFRGILHRLGRVAQLAEHGANRSIRQGCEFESHRDQLWSEFPFCSFPYFFFIYYMYIYRERGGVVSNLEQEDVEWLGTRVYHDTTQYI